MTDYEEKFIKFYKKFSIDSADAKTKLSTYGDELEYAYTLSQSEDLYGSIKESWKKIWGELTCKGTTYDKDPVRSSIRASLYGKHKSTLEKHTLFLFTEYNRIIEKLSNCDALKE